MFYHDVLLPAKWEGVNYKNRAAKISSSSALFHIISNPKPFRRIAQIQIMYYLGGK
jgi:hypothetical protein